MQAKWFAGLMEQVGFTDVHVRPAWSMSKEVERYPGEWDQGKPEGERQTMDFPFLLAQGRKP